MLDSESDKEENKAEKGGIGREYREDSHLKEVRGCGNRPSRLWGRAL